jgi:hypothetical protein
MRFDRLKNGSMSLRSKSVTDEIESAPTRRQQ